MSDTVWVQRWLEFAQDDLLAAKRLFNDYHPKMLEASCYHCQQAAEKALKAYLVLQEYEFPYVHDCRKLCLHCADYDGAFVEYVDDCADLSPYATRARYPQEDEMDEPEVKTALRKAERIVSFCAGLIAPEPQE